MSTKDKLKSNAEVNKGPCIIVNIKLTVQNILFYGGTGSMPKYFNSVHFQHFRAFFCHFHGKLSNCKMLMCTLFEGGGGV